MSYKAADAFRAAASFKRRMSCWLGRGKSASRILRRAGADSRPPIEGRATKTKKKSGRAEAVLVYKGPDPGGQMEIPVHTDYETPATVLWTGLEASTRAYARIVDEVNKLELSDLRRPEEP